MNFEMESLTIHFFTPLIIRDIWCVNAQVSVEKNLSRLHSWAPANVHLCQKRFFVHSTQKKTLLICFSHLLCSFWWLEKRKITFFPNLAVSRFEENSMRNLVWLRWILTVSWYYWWMLLCCSLVGQLIIT